MSGVTTFEEVTEALSLERRLRRQNWGAEGLRSCSSLTGWFADRLHF